jgi:NAD(P)-dependent dehydrogenase (short-subunit alcohol dehydrogenase family)
MAVSYQTHRSDIPLEERTYIVSGAGGGIGGAAVARLLRTGANVVGADLSGKRLAGTAEATKDLPGKFEVVKADLTTEDGVAQVVETAFETFGTVQGVANVAGGMVNINQDVYDVPLADYSLQDFIAMFALNVNSAFLMCRALEPHFFAQKYGKIVNVASLAAFANRLELGNIAYNSAKAAVIALTQTISVQSGRQGVRANCIAPGLVLSPRVQQFIEDDYMQRHLDYTTMGDLATPDDLAEGIAFFLEPQSDAVSGETMRVAAGVR